MALNDLTVYVDEGRRGVDVNIGNRAFVANGRLM